MTECEKPSCIMEYNAVAKLMVDYCHEVGKLKEELKEKTEEAEMWQKHRNELENQSFQAQRDVKEWKEAAVSWMNDFKRLKEKYEPEILVTDE